MNNKFDESLKTGYEGNGWSKYQLMVLQQLDDHNKVLQNLNKEVIEIKQTIAVSEAEQKMWKSQVIDLSDEMTEKMDHILYDDNGLAKKIASVERILEVEEQSTLKMKAKWALLGAVAVFLVETASRIFPVIWSLVDK